MQFYPWKARHLASFFGKMLPQDCQLCAIACGPRLLCEDCLQLLPKLGMACPVCAMPVHTGLQCGQCLNTPPYFDGTISALRYAFPADRVVLGLKYGARLPFAILLGDLLIERIPPHSQKPDLLIAMPLHRRRLAERGFNQALEIAKRISEVLGHPLHTEKIDRSRDTPHQADLPAEKRRANMRGAFTSNADLSGMSIAVVDDVMTTGASLNELARVLKACGAARVENWVAARTWPSDAA